MTDALARACLDASDIDYVNLHGTATPLNDGLEAKALARLTGADTPCSSTKGWTGHTLGAAGITEAVIACLCLQRQWVPGTLNCGDLDPDLEVGILQESRPARVRRVMSNSFGFGGSNCSLVLGRPA
jgi:3-oxoacyl-[acyl-carrier-protein] synthase-1